MEMLLITEKGTNNMDKNKRDKIKPARILSGIESAYADD